jgi:hypothetical protein
VQCAAGSGKGDSKGYGVETEYTALGGESVGMDMHASQQSSDDKETDTPLAWRTKSAQASKPNEFILPSESVILPDASDDEFHDRDRSPSSMLIPHAQGQAEERTSAKYS